MITAERARELRDAEFNKNRDKKTARVCKDLDRMIIDGCKCGVDSVFYILPWGAKANDIQRFYEEAGYKVNIGWCDKGNYIEVCW